METFFVMARSVLLFVALALPGFLMVKIGTLKEEHSAFFSKLLMYAAFPMMIFSGTVEKIRLSGEVFRDVAFGAVIAALGLALFAALAVLATVRFQNKKSRGMLRFSAAMPNNGFLGIPLGLAVFGQASPVMVPLISMNIITTVFLYTVGIFFVSGDKGAMSPKKALLSPALLAFLAGIAANLMGICDKVPEIGSFASHFSALVTPLSMTVLGMKLGAASWKKLFVNGRMLYVSLLKLLVLPAVFMAVLLLLRGLFPSLLPDYMILASFVAFAMPTAGLAPTLADTFNGSTEDAVACTLGTTLLSVFSIPLLYLFLHFFL